MRDYFSTPPRTGRTGVRPRSIADRFWLKVHKTDSCWLWTGAVHPNGYGALRDTGKYSGVLSAHHISWELHNGPIPNGLWVLHNCPSGDNPACVNPVHLWLGTHRHNVLDRDTKGRVAKGEQSGTSKLTESQVLAIRKRYAAGGITYSTIAREFHLSSGHVWNIVNRTLWRHI